MTDSKYFPPIKILGIASIIILLIGFLFPTFAELFLSERTQNSVLILSFPFVAIFVTIILMFILLIFMVALRFNNKIPYRTHHAIELTLVGGIVSSVVCLMQPWQMVSFSYGFLLLLFSTLGFILWSHVTPQKRQLGQTLLPFTSREQMLGAIAGALVIIVLTFGFASDAKPAEPYGYSQRQWDLGLQDEQKTEIIEEANRTYTTFTLPFFICYTALPGAIVFFIVREIVAAPTNTKKTSS